LKELRDQETKLFTEQHTKDVLTVERQILYDKVSNLKSINQNMGRAITKDKYHNNREEVEKLRRKKIDDTNEHIAKLSDLIEVE
jgi:hypothetical protein